MNSEPTPTESAPRPKPGSRLRIVGILVLILGLACAAVLYWKGASSDDSSVDLSTPQNSRSQARSVEMNFGQMGLMTSNAMEDLQDPKVQAGLIALVSIIVSGGCFYFAHLLSRTKDPDDPVG